MEINLSIRKVRSMAEKHGDAYAPEKCSTMVKPRSSLSKTL